MKYHVFIATTQGLVAVEDIELIDDPDVLSVVCLNGSAHSLNISGLYHNFVKKGTGIIHNDFGGCSYRLDVAAAIDQGNSWQFGFYLAHYLFSQNVLGNGQPEQGDKVFCVSGEINIKNRRINPVTHLDVKLALAQTQLTSWLKQQVLIEVLLPQQPQASEQCKALNPELARCCYQINTLEQAISRLNLTEPPDLLNSPERECGREREYSPEPKEALVPGREYIKPAAITTAPVTKQTWANSSSRFGMSGHQRLAFGCFIFAFTVLLAVFSVWEHTKKEPDTTIKSIAITVVSDQASLLVTTKGDSSLLAEKGCADLQLTELNTQELKHNKRKFTATNYANLCQLVLNSSPAVQQVLLINSDSTVVLPLQTMASPLQWHIPLPAKLTHDQRYFLILLNDKLSKTQQQQISQLIKQRQRAQYLSAPVIKQAISELGIDVNVVMERFG